MSKTKTSSVQKLYRVLHKEIHLMREMLTNLHQEELALLEHAYVRWFRIMGHRSDFVVDLQNLRIKRDQILLDEDLSVEVLTQIDQLFALIERINLQNCRNDALFEQVKRAGEMPLICAYPQPHKRKRKSQIAVLHKK